VQIYEKADALQNGKHRLYAGFYLLQYSFPTTGTTAATTRTIFAVLTDFSHSPYCIENNPDKDYTSNKHLKLLSDWKLTTY